MHFHWCAEETAILLAAVEQLKHIWVWAQLTIAQVKPHILRVLV